VSSTPITQGVRDAQPREQWCVIDGNTLQALPGPRLAAAHFRYLSAELRPLWGDKLRGERQLLLALQPLRLERLVDRLLQRLQWGVTRLYVSGTYDSNQQMRRRRGGRAL
jgi:hypothetical protein